MLGMNRKWQLCSLLPLLTNEHFFDDVDVGGRSCTLSSTFNRGPFPQGWAVMRGKSDD